MRRGRLAGLLLLLAPSLHAAEWVDIPAGKFLMGSTPEQIEAGYRISAAGYGHDRVRQLGWFDAELPQRGVDLPAYRIMKVPVTQADYARFVRETGHAPPFVDAATWRAYGLVHPYERVKEYLWRGDRPPPGRQEHPVVLVSLIDARDYARWLAQKTGRNIRLPTEAEWEKAMRGSDGRLFPWGNEYEAKRLNNADLGPFATMPVASFPQGASPYGVLDGAGQVYEWTSTPWSQGKVVVKGGSWDDHGGICRPAARHGRPADLKHILIGFRLVEIIEE